MTSSHTKPEPAEGLNLNIGIGIPGVGGRMGRAVFEAVDQADDMHVVGASESATSDWIGQDAGLAAGSGPVGISVHEDPFEAFQASRVIFDFTTPECTIEVSSVAAQTRAVHIIGTTGFNEEQLGKITAAARHAVIVMSGNMSLGVTVMSVLAEQAAALLPTDYQAEIWEMHHGRKRDAPSGTAKLLGEAVASGRGQNLEENSVFTRCGETGPRPEEAIGFAVMRGGTVIGDHSTIFAGPNERIELVHRAESRELFAHGALFAARWGLSQPPGIYSMRDVLGVK